MVVGYAKEPGGGKPMNPPDWMCVICGEDAQMNPFIPCKVCHGKHAVHLECYKKNQWAFGESPLVLLKTWGRCWIVCPKERSVRAAMRLMLVV